MNPCVVFAFLLLTRIWWSRCEICPGKQHIHIIFCRNTQQIISLLISFTNSTSKICCSYLLILLFLRLYGKDVDSNKPQAPGRYYGQLLTHQDTHQCCRASLVHTYAHVMVMEAVQCSAFL